MAVALTELPLISEEEYLERERNAPFKSEFRAGIVIAMAGATYNHNVITANLIRSIGNALQGKPCTVLASDMRTRIRVGPAYNYPDITEICGKPMLQGQPADNLTNPTLIVEVLSRSTAAYDRGLKFEDYKNIESLQTYVLVSQDRPRVEVFSRTASGQWPSEVCEDLGASVALPSIECMLRLSDVYEQVASE